MPERDPEKMLVEVEKIRAHVVKEGDRLLERWRPLLRRGAFASGAQNLAHYLAFRELDLRPTQQALVTWWYAPSAPSTACPWALRLFCARPKTESIQRRRCR